MMDFYLLDSCSLPIVFPSTFFLYTLAFAVVYTTIELILHDIPGACWTIGVKLGKRIHAVAKVGLYPKVSRLRQSKLLTLNPKVAFTISGDILHVSVSDGEISLSDALKMHSLENTRCGGFIFRFWLRIANSTATYYCDRDDNGLTVLEKKNRSLPFGRAINNLSMRMLSRDPKFIHNRGNRGDSYMRDYPARPSPPMLHRNDIMSISPGMYDNMINLNVIPHTPDGSRRVEEYTNSRPYYGSNVAPKSYGIYGGSNFSVSTYHTALNWVQQDEVEAPRLITVAHDMDKLRRLVARGSHRYAGDRKRYYPFHLSDNVYSLAYDDGGVTFDKAILMIPEGCKFAFFDTCSS